MTQKTNNSSSNILRLLRLEKTALKVYNKVTSRYEYPYLRGVVRRGEVLYKIIKPLLQPDDNFLDIMCGYSPLAAPLLKAGYEVTGYDGNRTAIKDLKNLYPEGNWVLSSYDNTKIQSKSGKPFTVFLLLGAFEICRQEAFIASIAKLLDSNKPRIFFLETNKSIEKPPTLESPFVEESATKRSIHLSGYNAMLRLFVDHGYEVINVDQYDANLEEKWATLRIYAILRAKKSDPQ
jgi:2-polyprenyl-3-methyl-5-hydroxy-6-metoxy-1,4-benzoquinol methylase